MASYNVPQFLDSGDKIFFTMNIRQLAYFLAAFALCALVFSVVGALVPGIGIYAIIPAIPVFALGAYLSLGRYNGRDSEVYIFKVIVYILKPRIMKFKRQPDYKDILDKYSKFSYQELNKKYSAAFSKDVQAQESMIDKGNRLTNPTSKIEQIMELSRKVDYSSTNAVIEYKKAEKLNERRAEQIKKWYKAKPKK